MFCPFRRRRVILVRASMVLWLFRAVSRRRVRVFGDESLFPAVRLPSRRMRLCWAWVAIWVWSHFSRSAVMRVCVWLRSGVLVSWWSGLSVR